jgi:SPP1 family predicted phage head-tail adaptor
MMPAGRRTKVLTLESPGDPVPDGAGGYTESWTPLDPPTAWAHLDALSAADMEHLTADTITASGTFAITLPYHPGVTVQTRLTYQDPDRGARRFQVLGLRDPDEARRELVLVAVEAL